MSAAPPMLRRNVRRSMPSRRAAVSASSRVRRIASCSTAPSGTGRNSPFEHGPSLIGSSSSGSHAMARTLRPVRTAPEAPPSCDMCRPGHRNCTNVDTQSRRGVAAAPRRVVTPPCEGARMVSILLVALLIVLAVGAAAGTSALVVSRHTADASPAPDPEDIANRIAQRAAQQQQAALGHLIETNRALLDAERTRSGEALASERSLMEAQFGNVRAELDKMTALVREFESGRGARIEELAGALAAQRAGIAEFADPAHGLREAL